MNTLYPTGRTRFLNGGADWDTDTFRVWLLGSGYTYVSTHEYASSLADILGTPVNLTGCVALNDGIADADDLTYMDVDIGETVERIVIAKWTGSAATSPLIYYADTNNDTTPINRPGNGAGIPLVWSSSDNRIFKL